MTDLTKHEREAVAAAKAWNNAPANFDDDGIPIMDRDTRIIDLPDLEDMEAGFACGYLAGQRAAFEEAAKIAETYIGNGGDWHIRQAIRARLSEMEQPR